MSLITSQSYGHRHSLPLLPLLAAFAAGATFSYCSSLVFRLRSLLSAKVFVLKDLYYQELGHAWDHETSSFKVIYRPLYHCEAKPNRFEAHALASSHFSRWEEKFQRVSLWSVPLSVRRLILPGPFTLDPDWTLPPLTKHLPSCTRSTRSLLPVERSHEAPRLADILGDFESFIDAVDAELRTRGLDAQQEGLEMDHICYRCATIEEYKEMCGALTQDHGVCIVEGMIGGRPISTIQLTSPIKHLGFSVSCIEIPCPKPGRHYESGLEHAEIVVGKEGDSIAGNAVVAAFMERMKERGASFTWNTSAMDKELNADVSHQFEYNGGKATVKFHTRPLYEVVALEIQHGAVVEVPENYFCAHH